MYEILDAFGDHVMLVVGNKDRADKACRRLARWCHIICHSREVIFSEI